MIKINKDKIKPQNLTTNKPVEIINIEKNKKTLGRPKLEDIEKSTKKVNCYITDKEYTLLRKLANNKNVSLNQYLKILIKKDLT